MAHRDFAPDEHSQGTSRLRSLRLPNRSAFASETLKSAANLNTLAHIFDRLVVCTPAISDPCHSYRSHTLAYRPDFSSALLKPIVAHI